MSSLAGRGKNTVGRIYTWAPRADWQETRFRLPQCSQVLPDSLNEEAAAPHTNQEAPQIYAVNKKQNTQAFFFPKLNVFPTVIHFLPLPCHSWNYLPFYCRGFPFFFIFNYFPFVVLFRRSAITVLEHFWVHTSAINCGSPDMQLRTAEKYRSCGYADMQLRSNNFY